MKTVELEAIERQTGVYGTVNTGDTVTVTESLAEELVAGGSFKKTTKIAETATPGEVIERNISGVSAEPVHADGTDREILNNEGRVLHQPTPAQVAAAQQVIEKVVQKEDAEIEKKEEKTAPQTKEDKPAANTKTK